MKQLNIILFSILMIISSYYNAQTFVAFKSKKYGYSFQYPSNFTIKTSKNISTDFNAVKEGNFANINMNTLPFDFANYGFDQVTKKTIEDAIKPHVSYFSISKFTKTKISGYNTIIIYCDVTSGEFTFSQITAFVYWPKNPLTFTCSSYKKDFNTYNNMFQKIITSLILK